MSRRRRVIGLIFVLSLVVTMASCREHQQSASEASAMVSPTQFGRAMEIVRETQSYVAWTEEGTCLARSMWVSALLAVEGIPSSAYMATPPSGHKLHSSNGVEWNYHMAVMIHATDSGEQMILDPAISDRPIVDHQWLAKIGGQGARIDIAPGSVYGNRMGPGQEFRGINIISNITAMPKFQESDVEKACGVIEQFQVEHSGGDPIIMKAKLHSEMVRVSRSLQTSGMIDFGTLTPGMIYCGRTKL